MDSKGKDLEYRYLGKVLTLQKRPGKISCLLLLLESTKLMALRLQQVLVSSRAFKIFRPLKTSLMPLIVSTMNSGKTTIWLSLTALDLTISLTPRFNVSRMQMLSF